MRDFLDNLLDQHSDAAPRIMPRLPSLFEPEATRGGRNALIRNTNAQGIEETGGLPTTPIAESTDLATAIEPIQQKAAPAPPVPANEEQPATKAILNESVFSVSLRGLSEASPDLGRDQDGMRATRSPSEPPTLTLSEALGGSDEAPPDPSSTVTPASPIVGRVHRTYRQTRLEDQPPASEAITGERTSVAERMNRSVFVLSPRENSGNGPASTRELVTVSELDERSDRGMLTPSVVLIAPVIPSSTGPEKPLSQPEPVINVTIGRIEVRATPASTQPVHKPRSTPPVMTLEEYLGKRCKEERR